MSNDKEPGFGFWMAGAAATVAGWIAAKYVMKPLMIFFEFWTN